MPESQYLQSQVDALTHALQQVFPNAQIPPICPLCKGEKFFTNHFFDADNGERYTHMGFCPTCLGKGFIT